MVEINNSAPSVVHSLIAQFAPEADVFEIVLGNSKLTFKPIGSYSDLKELSRIAGQYVTKAKAGKMPYDLYDADDETLLLACSMAQTSIEPKLSESELLELAGRAGFIFNTLKTQWEAKQTKPLVEAEVQEVDDLKND